VVLAFILLWFFREHWQGNNDADKYRLANRIVIVLDKDGEIWWINPANYLAVPLHTEKVSWTGGYNDWVKRAQKNCMPTSDIILWQCSGRVSWRFQDQVYSFSNEREFIQLVQKKAYGINSKTLQNILLEDYGAKK